MTNASPGCRVVLTVGNSMMGDDGAGPLLAELMQRQPIPGWVVIDGGSAPENHAHEVRALAPAQVIVVDAADMGLAPGEVRLVDDACIADMFFMTTHNLPLNFLIEGLREDVPEVRFLGVQPGIVAFSFPMSEAVRDAVTAIHATLAAGGDATAWAELEAMA